MTADIALLIALAISCATTVLIAVKSFEALREAFRTLDLSHRREDEVRAQLLDRLAARDLDHYKLYALAENGADEEQLSDEEILDDLHQRRPWIPGRQPGVNVPADFDPEAEGLPK
jgi:hypothetical protein